MSIQDQIELCIDARMAFSSGIGTVIRQIIPFLNQLPFKITLLVDRIGHAWCSAFKQIPFAAPIYSVKEQLLFPLKIPSCDLFWSPHYNVPLLPIRAKKRVATIHDVCHLALQDHLSLAEKFYARFMLRQAVQRSDAITTVSQFSKNELNRFIPADPHVIPLAANRQLFQPDQSPVREKYRLPDQYLLFVGNLKPHKNLSMLLSASLPLPLVIVGKKQGLRHTTTLPPNALFLENVPDQDLPALYSQAFAFLFPSRYEGFGLPPLEAMSSGCPTIVSLAASIPEVCADASLYIHPDLPEEASAAVSALLKDPNLRESLIQKGFERASHFDWSQTAQQYRKLFLNMLR